MLVAATLAIALGGLWLGWITRSTAVPVGWDSASPGFFVGWLMFSAVGALLATKRPRNAVGWLLLSIGMAWELHGLTGVYRVAALVERPDWPGGVWAAWGWDWTWVPAAVGVFLLPLLFPDGRTPSPRWRVVLILLMSGSALLVASLALRPGPIPNTPTLVNPVGIPGLAGLIGGTESIGGLLVTVGAIGAFASAVQRYRRADTAARQQLKWFAFAGVVVLAAFSFANVFQAAGADSALMGDLRVAPLFLLPVAIAVAVLGYRLYDIDQIISRTLSYALLTGVLAGVYVAAVLALSRLLGPLGAGSELSVAAATLAAAALFTPARRRIQAAVDRRFNRARYDAQRTVEAFTNQLRNEIDLDQLSDELVDVTRATLQPTRASVWLRGEPR